MPLESPYRVRHCPRCGFDTLHERPTRSGGGAYRGGDNSLTVVLAAFWYFVTYCLWPVVSCVFILLSPLFLALAALASFQPYWCTECGRRNFRPGGRPVFGGEWHREGPAYHYDEIRLVRLAPVAHENDLIGPIERLVRALRREGAAFRLHAFSPAHRLYRIRAGRLWSNVWKFVTTSAIHWHDGRPPDAPTHQVHFFHWPDGVQLKVRFVVAGAEATCPGVVVTLAVRTDKVFHPRGDRADRLDRLFSRMISILRPDHGCVRLSGQPEAESSSCEPEVGWITYLPQASAPPSVPPPAVLVPFADGVKIVAAPGPVPDEYGGGAAAIEAVSGVVPRGTHHD